MTDMTSPATSGPSAMTGAVPPVCTHEVAEIIFGNCTATFSLSCQASPTMHDGPRLEGSSE